MAMLVAEHVDAFVTVTVNDPLVVAVYEALIAPLIAKPLLNHWYVNPAPLLALRTTLPP